MLNRITPDLVIVPPEEENLLALLEAATQRVAELSEENMRLQMDLIVARDFAEKIQAYVKAESTFRLVFGGGGE